MKVVGLVVVIDGNGGGGRRNILGRGKKAGSSYEVGRPRALFSRLPTVRDAAVHEEAT